MCTSTGSSLSISFPEALSPCVLALIACRPRFLRLDQCQFRRNYSSGGEIFLMILAVIRILFSFNQFAKTCG